MENAQPALGQAAGRLPRLDRVRFLRRECEDPQRRGRHGYLFHDPVSRIGGQTFPRAHPAPLRSQDASLESLLDREQYGKIDPPVVGSFNKNGVGHFFGKDTLNGKPILVVFRWDARNKERPIWSQAFSPDNGKTWEWNFFNVSERPKE